ncbi:MULTISPECIES: prepilin-type N-terminal cleavage/methylation domain-containing protein [unclassified Caballeronia]|uniref:prepilin-type N-terminal cleavage/methylation domain-containing protein n=1 Tax=unclassified Caballeronia TaxID=2646786 RepID=UPI00285C6329|nr:MULTISPECIES: prepilin-type N-terminal cleavage/methylation domain-containing protein [unclassified Caballeronia]MDR5772986.1 prepilin-type N-terminal cleavage/methylation domain-containing protein [Caballeronia sp. LZ002]MDR5848420.1 prepilin-type N-terminal cleavage/methylation domain-containing protein [Caballeronia sp. LZ003]
MKRTAPSDAARQRGFTLLEMLIAIAILAVIAVLSWRGLDSIIRARATITNSMEDERVVAQLFDQMRIDARQAATDDEAGQPAVSIDNGSLQIVRGMFAVGAPPRLQVVRYRLSDGRIVRFASPPLANVGEVRRALSSSDTADGWNAVQLMGGVASLASRVYIPQKGWTTRMNDVFSQINENDNNLKVPQLGNAPLPRAVSGIQVAVGARNLAAPITRVFMVGE